MLVRSWPCTRIRVRVRAVPYTYFIFMLGQQPFGLFLGGQNFEWHKQQGKSSSSSGSGISSKSISGSGMMGRFGFSFFWSLGRRLVTALTAISVTGVTAPTVLHFKAAFGSRKSTNLPSFGPNPAGYISTRLSVFAVCAYVTWMFVRLACLLA